MHLKMLKTVHVHCRLSLQVVYRRGIWLEILQALTKHAQQLLKWFIAPCSSSLSPASQLFLSFAVVA